MNRKELGQRAEDLAGEYLKKAGLEIVERNYYIRGGELDIIALEGETVVFVEVRSKSSDCYGLPEETVTEKKQGFLYRAAEQYLIKNEWLEKNCRFDVVSVLFKDGKAEIKWYKDAFTQ